MTQEDYKELKKMFMEDQDFLEYLRSAFVEVLQTKLSLKVRVEGDRKRCLVCGAPMNLRVSKKNAEYFFGCGNYPRCQSMEQASDKEVEEYMHRYPTQGELLRLQKQSYLEELELRKERDEEREAKKAEREKRAALRIAEEEKKAKEVFEKERAKDLAALMGK